MSSSRSSRPWRQRRRLLSVAAVICLAVGAGACAVEQSLPPPDCESGGSGLIVAQSVPTASQVPCVGTMPDGWTVAAVAVDQDGSRVTFDSDRAGEGAALLHLADDCDTAGATKAPTDQPAATRYDRIDQVAPSFAAERFYVFDGGCVWWSFRFDRGASATESVAIGDTLMLVSRLSINNGLRDTFLDEEL